MTTEDELQSQVDERWAALEQPAWPPPRGWMDPPADEGYSRVTDPARYRIVHERAKVWAEVLGGLRAVRSEPLGPGLIPVPGGDPPVLQLAYDRGVRLACERTGTLSLLMLERSVASRGSRRSPSCT